METNEVKAQPAVLEMKLQITRAATGKTEEFTLIGTPVDETPAEPEHKEQ